MKINNNLGSITPEDRRLSQARRRSHQTSSEPPCLAKLNDLAWVSLAFLALALARLVITAAGIILCPDAANQRSIIVMAVAIITLLVFVQIAQRFRRTVKSAILIAVLLLIGVTIIRPYIGVITECYIRYNDSGDSAQLRYERAHQERTNREVKNLVSR